MSEEVKQTVVEAAPEPSSTEAAAPEVAPESATEVPPEAPAPTTEATPLPEEGEKEKSKGKKEKKDAKMRFSINFPHMKNPLKGEKKTDTAHSAPTVPAYRFISSMQGHGYPVTPITPTTPATTVHEAAEGKTRGTWLPGIMHINKKKAAAPAPATTTPEVPAYRFISTMAGYGYPHVAVVEKPVPVPVTEKRKWTSLIPAVKAKRPSKDNVLEATVPAYRFITSMQGHGYPVIPVTPAPEPKKKSSTAALFGGIVGKVKALGSHKDLEEEGTSAVVKEAVKDTEVAVPAYRFIATMQGHGYPVMPTPTPASPEATKPKRTSTNVREKIAGLGHRLTTKRLRGEKEEHREEAPAPAPIAEATVPAYRFISSMQGHGYPVMPVAATEAKEETKAESKREEKRGILHTLTKRLTFKKKKGQDVSAEVVEKKEVVQTEVPAHRFLVSMQGHGYPVVPVAVPEPPKEAPAQAPEAQTIEHAQKEPEAAAPVPAPATAPEEKKKEGEGGVGRRLMKSLTGMFRREKKVQPTQVAAA
eukprot:comp22121_c0_seq1/m.32339 comp22121_c0_seq1/g.32339  ORF comp22121_c0_seq1/g.32339 comp22121_c0_seq1/m.32339 type:complete len:531 (-) comp22121_c0_seq1:672-2264(-)